MLSNYYLFMFFMMCLCLLTVVGNFVKFLIVLENFKMIMLFYSMIFQLEECGLMFLSLLVVMTLEVSLGLVLVSRLWFTSDLKYIVSL